MKTCKTILPILRLALAGGAFLMAAVFLCSGCRIPDHTQTPPAEISQGTSLARIRLSTLTGFETEPDKTDQLRLKVVVEVFDAADKQIQIPCVFRFELYDFQILSSDWRGRRLMLWPDRNLTSMADNEAHWTDYLKAYQFNLPVLFSPQPGQQYVLEATCLFGEQRYTDLIKIAF